MSEPATGPSGGRDDAPRGRTEYPAGPQLPGPALLFCPADRPDRYAKALAAADGQIANEK